ncbi:hypothetical protein DFH28DRAFT_697818 [Melampsora americana]|nr:hypothetical protein DFH28DRAFT_697818 [Melampsora americana]
MNHARVCLYIWVLTSAGTVLANFVGMGRKCDGCSKYKTFEDVESHICSKAIACPQCNGGQTKCHEVAALSQQCRECHKTRKLAKDHDHEAVACHACIVARTASAEFVELGNNCDKCRRYNQWKSIEEVRMCKQNFVCARCPGITECPEAEVYFYQCKNCHTIVEIKNKHDHKSVLCLRCKPQDPVADSSVTRGLQTKRRRVRHRNF